MSAIESRISNGRKQMKRGGYGPLDGQPYINRFNPARAAACAQVKVPYGQVYVAGVPSHIRSHEIRLDSKDRSCFITQTQLEQHREENAADAAWFASFQAADTATAATAGVGA